MNQDSSTIRDLTPMVNFDFGYKKYKSASYSHGSYFLKQRRPSKVPSSSRNYIKGDPPNLIDWKAYARTDALLVREIRDEARAQVVVICDGRDTMLWPEEKEEITKFEIVCRIALNISFRHCLCGDRVHLNFLEENDTFLKEQKLMTFKSAASVVEYYEAWLGHRFSFKEIKKDLSPRFISKGSDIVYTISDFINPFSFSSLDAKTAKNFIQVLHSREIDLDWIEESRCYFDEKKEKNEYIGSILKQGKNYGEKLEQWQKSINLQVKDCFGSLINITDQTSIPRYFQEMALFEF